jgi:ubiquinone biosynthesis protein UbiJ
MTDPAQIGAEMLATLGNAILKLDPLSEPKLRELEGLSVRLDVALPGRNEPTRWLMSFHKASVQLEPCSEIAAHAIVAGEVSELLAWLTGGASGGLRFDGDTRLLDSLSGLMHGYQPDLAPPLGRVIGDDAASALVGFLEAASAAARSAIQTLRGAAQDTARQNYASPDEMSSAIHQLEDLALKVDRLTARTDRLENLRRTDATGHPE